MEPAALSGEGLAFTSRIPFAVHMGMRLTRFADGESRMEFDPGPEHLNTFDVVHGGACMTLLDIAMAAAARSVAPELGVVTIEMKTTFMQPSVGPLRAHGRLLHRTAAMAFVEATIYDENDRLCAQASGTFKYVKRRLPTGPGGTHEMRPPSTD